MNVLILLASALMGTDLPHTYEEIHDQAFKNCRGANRPLTAKRLQVMKDLILIERAFFLDHPEIPKSLKGMVIAAACNESRFNPKARGDWRTNKRGKRVSKAHGVLQLWPWWIKKYQIDRDDHIAASKIWLERVVYQYQKNKRYRRCPSSFSEERKWIAAWVQTTRGNVNKKNRYRCYQKPSHYRLLKRWVKNIYADRELKNLKLVVDEVLM